MQQFGSHCKVDEMLVAIMLTVLRLGLKNIAAESDKHAATPCD